MNGKFRYEAIDNFLLGNGPSIKWTVSLYDVTITGKSKSVKQAYRHARRAVRRERRMWHFLNPPK